MAEMPNVVVLINDQHAHDVLGPAGFGALRTPTFDRLAADGVRFTQASCAATPCLPSRHNLLHGLYAFQTGVVGNGSLLPPEEVPDRTMGRLFQEAGYRTGAFGKMHLFPYSARTERGSYFGFESRSGHFHEGGELMDDHFARAHRDWAEALYAEGEARGISKGGDGCAADYLGYESELPLERRCDWWSAGKAAEFVGQDSDRPFLAICSLIDPHAPNIVPRDLAGLYDPGEVPVPAEVPADLPDARAYPQFAGLSRDDLRTVIARYMALVTATDHCHARVLDALDRRGLYDETLIIFLSDHGELLGSRGKEAFSKYNLYERAVRIPLIIKPPKSLGTRAGAISDELVSIVDVLPTMLSTCGLEGAGTLPGMDLAPLLLGRKPERRRRAAITEFYQKGVRYLAVRSREWKYVRGPHGEELYHLAEDPHEFRNLTGEPEAARRIAELKTCLIEEEDLACGRRAAGRGRYPRTEWSYLAE